MFDYKPKKYVFKDGLTLYYQKHNINKAFHVIIGTRTGSLDDDIKGISHLLEHMLFKGTTNRTLSDINEATCSYASGINAFTSVNEGIRVTNYQTDKHINEVFDLISDMWFNSSFDETALNNEKKVILQEMLMYEDEGASVATQDVQFSTYVNQGNLDILGTKESVNSITRDDLINYRNKILVPNNFVVAITTRLSFNKIKKLVMKTIDSKFTHNTLFPHRDHIEVNGKPCVHTIYKDRNRCFCEIKYIVLKHRLCDRKTEYILTLISNVLSRIGGRLWKKLREEKSLVYYYRTFGQPEYNSTITFSFMFECSKENVNDCIDVITKEVADLVNNGLTEQELEAEKTNALESFDKRSIYVSSPLGIIRLFEEGSDHKYISPAKALKMFKKTTLEDVNTIIHEVFTNQPFICVVGQVKDEDIDIISKTKTSRASKQTKKVAKASTAK